ncbi:MULTISPECIES: DUF4214 domain-containing protein [Stutzerimonas stutzeri subgroup]|uniref:Outer membrane adhesin-like protein n=1 Tax=Stutzerimonas stutzeri CCUG 29243 TaxID=1196835 RepID=I4CNS6_STUST|nr:MULTISPECIES: DUF4214 domain-containing protein [Stutzerimonas stutzeri subgroup]AFM31733.1 outer membrane adhesin-like protein [Stutzerimonas stutzeri CCUG 29243]MCQ2037469.1 DUF4214 domain-containing protein [Stutzerimonas kunmingensis]
MANAIASQVQALYVGYLGRAADQAGLNFWTNAITAGTSTLESVALGFTLSQEYTSKYEGLSNEELAAAIYENVLGRAADADGLAFWVGELENGVQTPETLLAAMINSLGSVDQQVIDNKVIVANAYTVAAGAEYDVAEGAAIIADVDGTAGSVADALAQIDELTFSVPTTLAALANAQEAVADFLEGVDLDDDADTATTADQVKDLVDASAGAGNPVADFNSSAFSSVDLAATSTAAQQTSAFAAARANAQSDIDAQQAVVDAAQAEVNKLDKTKVANYQNALSTQETAAAAAAAAAIKETGAEAEYNAQNASVETTEVTVDVAGTIGDLATTTLNGLVTVDDTGAVDVLKAAAGVTETTNPGITSLLALINARVAADVAELKADAAVTSATTALAGGAATVDTLVAEKETLVDTQDALIELNELITDVQEGYALNAQLSTLEAAVEDASLVLTDAGYTVNVLDGTTDDATSGNDVFVFNGDAATITGTFSQDDVLFIGEGYKLVVIDNADDLLNKSVGDVNALEVFYNTDTGLVYVESETFAGNAASGADLISITGLPTGAELELNGSFLQLA